MRRIESFALALLVLAASLHFFSVPVADNDLWGHVLFGRKILAEGLATRNEYSYTEPDHAWINHEILAECALGWSYDRFGSAGLLALKWLSGLAMLVILARIARRRGAESIAIAFTLVLAASLSAWGYNARPQIFTFLFLAAVWDVLDRVAAGGSPNALWVLPPLVAIWVNTHGGVLAGVGIVVVATLFLAVREPAHRRLASAMPVVATVAALLANPYGWHLPAFLVRDVQIDRPISEWASIPLFDSSNLQFKIAALVAILGFARAHWRRQLWESAVIVAAAVAALRHERHLPLFAIVAAPHLSLVFSGVVRRLRMDDVSLARDRAAAWTVSAGVLVLAVFTALPSLRTHYDLGMEIEVPRSGYPVDAVSFLRESGLRGNLAVPFAWGEYAIWHLYPAFHVSIDGRYTTAYSLEATDYAWRYLDGGRGWDRHLEGANVALTDARHVTARLLQSRGDWRLIYADATASLFVREGSIPASFPRPDRSTPSRFP